MTQLSEQDTAWIEGYCNQLLSTEEFDQFQDALEQRPDLRAALRQYLALDANLRQGTEAMEDIETAWSGTALPASDKVMSFPKIWPLALSAGIAALLVVGLFALFAPEAPLRVADQEEPTANGFGVLTGQDAASWAHHKSLATGDLIPTGPLELTRGFAQLELFSGVTLVIEGDAAFEIVSPMEIAVIRGKVRAQVPEPARGFRLRFADHEVVDLGTEFAVEIAEDYAEIHVLDGEVLWKAEQQKEPRAMKKGEALRLQGTQPPQHLAAVASRFVGMNELNERMHGGREDRRKQWLSHSQNLSRDPRLVAYYPMSQSGHWQRTLYDESRTQSNGAIVAAARTTDRFGATNGALDFSPAGSRVRIHVEQPLSEITFLTWVKIDSLDRWYNSLLLTDGHELNEPHWQIMDDGRIFFSVRKLEKPIKRGGQFIHKQVVYSPSFWTPERSGRWLQIATTYNGKTGDVAHYLNGKALHRETISEDMRVNPVKIGAASIGNWSTPNRDDAHFAVRNLNGSMDEFAIFSEALSEKEIAELYESGRP
jgi:hypothetical protein